ncbi:MAG: hypothetical protein MOB07_28800 [Acidobacteria bacterium]|nr:hypothetical protein [Acidobacteriota bacterium]
MIANSIHKSTGCGCGGGATISIAQCSCGGAGCASCQGQGIVRPRFFAGQLLTEDDLQLLTDYVGQKNRLHNRYLFGAGVVCGLEVTCHPCGDGRVIAHPGYALDCCGNDLTLACAATLDINAMIRDLRRDQLGGFDCVDPCPDPPKSEADCQDHTDAANQKAATTNPPQYAGDQEPKPPARKYCLYIRYCEQETDPVTPYSTGDDCGRQRCEPTRVREGVKFELRCKPTGDAAHPLIRRLCACLGDLNKLRRAIALAQQLRTNTQTANNTLATGIKFSSVEIQPLIEKTTALDNVLKTLPPSFPPVVLGRDTAPATAPTGTTASAGVVENARSVSPAPSGMPQNLISSVGEVAILVNRFNALPPGEQTELLNNNENLSNTLQLAQKGIEQVRQMIVQNSTTPFNELRDWLIERLNNSPFLTDCTLRGRVFTLVMPAFSQQIGDTGTRTLVSANRPLIEAFLDFLRDCICRALNPACEPCDDTGVLLACLEVEECKVVRICNLERDFVLSPAAVRYWLPPLKLIGNLAERLCCDPFESLLTPVPGRPAKRFDFVELLRQETERILKDSLCSFADMEMLGSLMSDIGRVFQSDSFRTAVQAFTVGPEAAAEAPAGAVGVEMAGAAEEKAREKAVEEEEEEEEEEGETEKKRPASKRRTGQRGGKK